MVAGSQDDLIFEAIVNDKTIEFFERFDKRIDELSNTAERGFSNLDERVGKTGKVIGVLSGVVSTLATRFLNMAIQGVAGLKNYLTQAALLTARVDTLGIVVDNLGRRAGFTQEQIDEFEESIKSMGITTQVARQSMARMIQAQIDLGEAANLARVAQDAAVIAGVNSSQAFDRLVLAIQRRDIQLLDSLGLVVDQEKAQKRLAKELGVTTKSLSEQQKQTAFLNDVYRAGELIAGSYEEAMGSVGKNMTSTARHAEELMLAIGRAFQPALTAQVNATQEALKEMLQWVQDNEEAINDFGESLAKAVTFLFEFAAKFTSFIASAPGKLVNFSVEIAKVADNLLGLGIGIEQIDENAKNMGDNFKQAIALFVAFLAGIVFSLKQLVIVGSGSVEALFKVLQGDIEGAEKAFGKAEAAAASFFDKEAYEDAFTSALFSTAEFLGLLEDMDDVAAEAERGLEGVADAAEILSDAIEDMNADFQELFEQFQQETADIAIQEARRIEEEALRMSFKIEDIERRHVDRVRQILENSQDTRARTIERHAETRLNIERDFQRRLQDLRSQFDFDAEELARKRDAIGLLRLMRGFKQDISEEKKNTARKRQDAQFEFEKQIKQQQEALRKQLEDAEIARARDYDNLARNLERQRRIRELHNRFREEDRRRRLRIELLEIANQYRTIEGMTAEFLNRMIQIWFDRIVLMREVQNSFYGVTNVPQSEFEDVPTDENPAEGVGRIGQAGQVSQLLADSNRFMTFGRQGQVPAIPTVGAGRSRTSRREIIVRVEGNALEPAIQRQLVAMLTEVERNRG